MSQDTVQDVVNEDPCAVLAELRQKHRDLVTGGALKRVRHDGAQGSRREIERHEGDVAALEKLILRYEGLCSASLGQPRRRFAMIGF